MKVSELLRDAVIVDEDETVSQTISKMARERVRDMFLVKNGRFQGMITHHSLLDAFSGADSTKIKTFIFSPPTLGPKDDVEKAMQFMLEVGIENVPVVEGKKLLGRVAIEDVMRKFSSDGVTAGDVMTPSPRFVYEDDTIAQARAVMKNHGISRLLVMNRNGKLAGIVTASDIIRKNVPNKGQRRGAMGGYKSSLLNSPVTNCMSKNVETVLPSTDLNKVVEMMIKHGIRLVPVVENGKPLGLVSRKQILKLMAGESREGVNVSFSGMGGIEPFEFETLKQLVAGYVKKIGKSLSAERVEVKMKKIGHGQFEVKVAALGKTPLMAESTAFDPISAVSQALRILEREVRHD